MLSIRVKMFEASPHPDFEEQVKEVSSPTVDKVEDPAVSVPAPTQQDAPEPEPAPVLSEEITVQLTANIPANSSATSENAGGAKESVQPSGKHGSM